jgi:hypothetical protein
MRSRARAFSLAVDGVDNLRPPHGPCPPSYSQLSGPPRENASALGSRQVRITRLEGDLEIFQAIIDEE